MTFGISPPWGPLAALNLPYHDFPTSLGTDFPTGCLGCQLWCELISKVSADEALGICILMGELLQEFRP